MSEKSYMGLRGKKLRLAVNMVATCGFLLFGYDQGVMSGIITAPEFNYTIPETDGDSTMQGLVTAIYEVGCLAGAMITLFAGERLGRRRTIMTGAVIMLAGVLIQILTFRWASPLAQFIVGRVVMGVGNGMNTSSIPTYQAECAKPHLRGLLICISGASIAFGTLISYWLNYGMSFTGNDLVWRFPIAFQIVFAVFILGGLLMLPESPRWLLSKPDREPEALNVISALNDLPIDSDIVQQERRIILDSIAAAGVGRKSSLKDLITNGRTQHLRRCLIGSSSQIMQQIGGCNAVIYYLPILFEDSLKLDRNMSLILGGVNMIVYSIFATASWYFIERAGRRKLFLIGTVGQCLSMTITFACLIPGTVEAAKGAVVGLFLYISAFGATWLPLPWLYPAEINPLATRGKANAVSTVSNWSFNFAVVMITPILIEHIEWGTYVLFAGLNACFLPIIWLFYPETKNRTLEEIDIIFAKGYSEKMSYVRAANELPKLDPQGIEEYAARYGVEDDVHGEKGARLEHTPSDSEDNASYKGHHVEQRERRE